MLSFLVVGVVVTCCYIMLLFRPGCLLRFAGHGSVGHQRRALLAALQQQPPDNAPGCLVGEKVGVLGFAWEENGGCGDQEEEDHLILLLSLCSFWQCSLIE